MDCRICGGPAVRKYEFTEYGPHWKYAVWRCGACHYDFLHPFRGRPIRAARNQFSFWTEGLEAKVADYFARSFKRHVPLKKGRVLDVGCGEGHFVSRLLHEGYHAEGLDVETASIETAKKRYPSGRFTHSGLGTFTPRESFQAITLWQVLEHIPDPLNAIRKMRPWLAPKGYLVVDVPHGNDLMKTIASMFLMLRMKYPLQLFYSADHVNLFTRESLVEMFRRSGYEVKRVEQRESYVTQFSLNGFPLHIRVVLKALAMISHMLKREAVITVVAQKTNAPDELFAQPAPVQEEIRRAA